MGAVDHAVETALKSSSEQLARTDNRLALAEAKHVQCEENLDLVHEKLDDLQRQLALIREEEHE